MTYRENNGIKSGKKTVIELDLSYDPQQNNSWRLLIGCFCYGANIVHHQTFLWQGSKRSTAMVVNLY